MLAIPICICTLVCFSVPMFQEIESELEVTVRDTSQISDSQQAVEKLPQSIRSTDKVDSVWYGSNRSRLNGKWQLAWSDEIDEVPVEYPHVCNIEFKEINGMINGEFIGPVAGRERDAIISGSLQGSGQVKVLMFQQRERGYICAYQAIEKGGEILGVWHDTQNRSGRFRLLKHQ